MSRALRPPSPARAGSTLLVASLLLSGTTVPTRAQDRLAQDPPAQDPRPEAAEPMGGPQEAPVTLRLDGRSGDRAVYGYEQRIDLQMPPEFGGEQSILSRLVVDQRVDGIDETSIRYLAEVREIGVEMENSPGGDLDVSRFQGRLREVTAVGGTDLGVAQLQQSMRQVGFPILPPRPVRVGDSWVDTTRIDAAAMALPAEGEIVSVSRTTLERLVRTADGTIARLAVETEFHFEPGEGAIPSMRVEVRGRRGDDVRFDVERGRYLTSEGTQEFEMTMAIPGATGSLSIRGTATSSAERLPES